MHPARIAVMVVAAWASIAVQVVADIGPNDNCPVETPYPPPMAAAGTIYNGDMEGGFTGGVANQWVGWKDREFTGQVHFAGTDRVYLGTASQKLNLPQPTDDETSAGLYQQIWVVPGETYTATARVYIVFPDNLPIDDVYASMGLDNFGQPSGHGSGMTWCCDNGVYTRNRWMLMSVTVRAVNSVMTLSLRATRKWAKDGNGALFWFDDVTFSGPMPTGTRPGPEVDPPDPESIIPACSGENLVANPSFEQTFTGGVCAGWNKWSTAGFGRWRQSTRLGKIGGGKYGSGGEAEFAAMYAKTNLLFGAEPGYDGTYGSADGQYVYPQMDNAIYIGRPFIDDYQEQFKSDPPRWGAWLADKLYEAQLRHPRIDAWQGFNEPDWGGTWQQVLAFEKAFAERCHYWGMKVCSLNLSTGSPGNLWRMVDESYSPSCRDLLAVADYLGHHCYGGPDTDLMVSYEQTSSKSSPCDFALRPRRFWDMYRKRGWRLPPVIATEGSTWGAWHDVFPPSTIGNDIVTMGSYMNANRWWCGYTNFTCGAFGSGNWEGWDIIGQGTIVQDIGNFNSNHPADAMDGLYSQMFGAGKVHPYTQVELAPAGQFNGGINQLINGVSPGEEYLVKAWIKWEYRGHPPTALKFYLGVDQTGQTTDGSAATINWGDEQVARNASVHEIFSHAWRTFTATGNRISLWLRASQDVSDPSFMFYVDNVEVRQIDPPAGPVIALSTYHLDASTSFESNPPATSFTIRNSGAGTLAYSFTSDLSWVRLEPPAGTSTGEPDAIGVTYHTDWLAPGEYAGDINVTAEGATNTPQTISISLVVQPPPHAKADFDCDRDVDQTDFGHLQMCLSGMSISQPDPFCQDAKLDGDDDVDENDAAILWGCLNGPGHPVRPGCPEAQ